MQREPHPPFTEQNTLSGEPTDNLHIRILTSQAQPYLLCSTLLCHQPCSHHITSSRVSSFQTLPPSSVRSRSYSQCRPGNSVADKELVFWVRGRTDREWEGGYDVDVREELGRDCGCSLWGSGVYRRDGNLVWGLSWSEELGWLYTFKWWFW